jgi:hypothetical protein
MHKEINITKFKDEQYSFKKLSITKPKAIAIKIEIIKYFIDVFENSN